MMYVHYEQAVEAMTKGLSRSKHLAEIFAGNSLDGIYSHGMNRYPRYISDMESGICDPGVTEAEKVGGYGALEPSTGNNPITFAIPREKGSLVWIWR